MHIPALIFQGLLALADTIFFGFSFVLGLILFSIAVSNADGDEYFSEGGMSLPGEPQIELTE